MLQKMSVWALLMSVECESVYDFMLAKLGFLNGGWGLIDVQLHNLMLCQHTHLYINQHTHRHPLCPSAIQSEVRAYGSMCWLTTSHRSASRLVSTSASERHSPSHPPHYSITHHFCRVFLILPSSAASSSFSFKNTPTLPPTLRLPIIFLFLPRSCTLNSSFICFLLMLLPSRAPLS